MNELRIFSVGEKIGEPIYIIALAGTYDSEISDEGSSLGDGAGHQAEDGDLIVDENDGTLISYRVPDLSGASNTAIVGENSFDLSQGRCFILTNDYSAIQIASSNPDDAIALHSA